MRRAPGPTSRCSSRRPSGGRPEHLGGRHRPERRPALGLDSRMIGSSCRISSAISCHRVKAPNIVGVMKIALRGRWTGRGRARSVMGASLVCQPMVREPPSPFRRPSGYNCGRTTGRDRTRPAPRGPVRLTRTLTAGLVAGAPCRRPAPPGATGLAGRGCRHRPDDLHGAHHHDRARADAPPRAAEPPRWRRPAPPTRPSWWTATRAGTSRSCPGADGTTRSPGVRTPCAHRELHVRPRRRRLPRDGRSSTTSSGCRRRTWSTTAPPSGWRAPVPTTLTSPSRMRCSTSSRPTCIDTSRCSPPASRTAPRCRPCWRAR